MRLAQVSLGQVCLTICWSWAGKPFCLWLLHGSSDVAGAWLCCVGLNATFPTSNLLQEQQP